METAVLHAVICGGGGRREIGGTRHDSLGGGV
jgi:hypothetical protein